MERHDDRLKELIKALADTISSVFSRNDEIRQALYMIEKEGYHVDLILASVTRVSKKEEGSLETTITDFDRAFLKKVRLCFDEGDN